MRKLFSFFIFLLSQAIHSQNMNSCWVFGDSAGIDFSNLSNPVSFSSGMDGRGSCVSISDSAGGLLFYSFTRAGNWNYSAQVFNNLNQLMQNGDSLIGEGWYHEEIIVPKPGNNNLFYIFHIGEVIPNTQGFYYSIIDMNANGGLGAVIQKNTQLNNFRNADCVTAIKHGNGRDWWVLSKYSNINATTYNRFYFYLITEDSIYPPIIQDMNNATDYDVQSVTFNSNGTKIMQINVDGFMCEYDFNRCTGIISNPNLIFPAQTNNYTRIFWSGAYSNDDSKFYISIIPYSLSVSDTSWLFQYDLSAANIPASCDTLFMIKHFQNSVQGGSLRLAPNGKIYYSSMYWTLVPNGYPFPDSVYNQYNMNLSVINHPDSLGVACNFQPFSFYLGGKRTYYGLPNNPNYGLGKLVGSPCDTIQYTGLTPGHSPKGEGSLTATYISAWQKLFVNAQNIKGKNCVLKIFDVNGRVLKLFNKTTQQPYFTHDVDVSSLASGLYLVNLITEKEMLSAKFVKD